MEAGSMEDGGVSIAVRSIFPFKQARLLSYEVRQEPEKMGEHVVRRRQRFVAMSSDRIIGNRANDVNRSELRGRWNHG
jgi:hypothetical protein